MCVGKLRPSLSHYSTRGGGAAAGTHTQPGPGDGTNNNANVAARACIGSNSPLSLSHEESSSQFPIPIRSQSPNLPWAVGLSLVSPPLTLVHSPMQHITHPPMSRLDPRSAAGAQTRRQGQAHAQRERSGQTTH